jgi:thermitase
MLEFMRYVLFYMKISRAFAREAMMIARLLILSLITLLLVACSSSVPVSEVKSYPYTLTVDLQEGDTIESLEAGYAGKVLLWQPEDGFAVLGMDETSGLQTLGSEPNINAFWANGRLSWMGGSVSAWAGGSVSAWAGGSVSAWAGGSVSAWAGGRYVPMPQNTAKWQKIKLQEAQTLATNLGTGIKVAVIDSGVDLNHPGLRGGFVAADQMWDYVDNDAIPQENGTLGTGAYGHGTNVASIVLQIAPKAKIMPLRVLKPNGSGDTINVAAAIKFAVNKGAKVINLSLGSSTPSTAVTREIQAATSKGIFVIASSGNDGNTAITYPANQTSNDSTTLGKFSVSVGSVDAGDAKSWFSTYGLNLEMVAPGQEVYGPVPGNRMGAWSGTSMAAPMISGAIALALAETLYIPKGLLTDMLESRAANIYQGGLNGDYENEATGEEYLGEGRLDVHHFIYDATRP